MISSTAAKEGFHSLRRWCSRLLRHQSMSDLLQSGQRSNRGGISGIAPIKPPDGLGNPIFNHRGCWRSASCWPSASSSLRLRTGHKQPVQTLWSSSPSSSVIVDYSIWTSPVGQEWQERLGSRGVAGCGT